MAMEKWRENPDEELAKIFKRSELSTFWSCLLYTSDAADE